MSCGRSSDSLRDLSLLSSHPRLAGNDTSVEGATSEFKSTAPFVGSDWHSQNSAAYSGRTVPDFHRSSLFTRPPESRQKQLAAVTDGVVDESPQRR